MTHRRTPKPADQTRAVAYIRVSKDDQELSPEAQRAGIARWALQRGVQVTSWHVDAGVHGDSACASRPGLTAALAALGVAGLLVALRRDRVARDPFETALLERELGRRGVRLVTADGVSDEQTPEGALLRTVLDGIAAFEVASIRRRTREALAAKRARGEVYGKVPFGFRREGNRLVEDESEQATLAQARALHASGISLRRVAAGLSSAGHVSRGGRPYSLSAVHAMMQPAPVGSSAVAPASASRPPEAADTSAVAPASSSQPETNQAAA